MKVSRAICITAILILVLVFLIPAKVSAQEEDWSKERIKVSLGPPLSTQPKVIEVESNIYIAWVEERTLMIGKVNDKRTGFDGPETKILMAEATPRDFNIVHSNIFHAVWWEKGEEGNTIHYISGLDWNIWGSEKTLVPDINVDISGLTLASVGNYVYVVWSENKDGTYVIRYLMSKSGGVEWSDVKTLSNTTLNSISPTIALYRQHVYLAWAEKDINSSNYAIVVKASNDFGESWRGKVVLTQDVERYSYYNPKIAVTSEKLYCIYAKHFGNNSYNVGYIRTNSDLTFEAGNILSNKMFAENAPNVSLHLMSFGAEDFLSIVWCWGDIDNRYKLNYLKYAPPPRNAFIEKEREIISTTYPVSSFSFLLDRNQFVHVVWAEEDLQHDVYYFNNVKVTGGPPPPIDGDEKEDKQMGGLGILLPMIIVVVAVVAGVGIAVWLSISRKGEKKPKAKKPEKKKIREKKAKVKKEKKVRKRVAPAPPPKKVVRKKVKKKREPAVGLRELVKKQKERVTKVEEERVEEAVSTGDEIGELQEKWAKEGVDSEAVTKPLYEVEIKEKEPEKPEVVDTTPVKRAKCPFCGRELEVRSALLSKVRCACGRRVKLE